MTTLHDIFKPGLLNQMVAEGYVRVQLHPTAPLSIANYAEKCQYERVWNDVTLASRGLIYNSYTLEIVARGFNKFFNWDDSTQPYPPAGAMVMSTKFDGSLGILYQHPQEHFGIATRGSFASEQALHASQRLFSLMDEYDLDLYSVYEILYQNATPVFEIIYPQNRIVVDYKGEDRLVLLDVIDNATGKSRLDLFDSFDWPDKAEKRLVPGGFSVDISHQIPTGEEGFVLYWPHTGFRCKMKSADYVELHRMVTGLSEKTLWESLGAGKSAEAIKDEVPDELHAWVDEKAAAMYEKVGVILDQAQDDFDEVRNQTLEVLDYDENHVKFRSTFARFAAGYVATRAYLFKILDGADESVLWSMAWKSIRPVGDTRVWNNPDKGDDTE